MPQILEVIATSLSEAREAHAGGADRLELVRSLDQDGLSPDLDLLYQILPAVPLPVRVMVRENASMLVADDRELSLLRTQAKSFVKLSIDGFTIDGLVLGWITPQKEVDVAAVRTVLTGLQCRVTFHRAIEHVAEPLQAIRVLKQFPQIDRILSSGGQGPWAERKARLLDLQKAAAPEIKILVAAGIAPDALSGVFEDASFSEVHVGRAVRQLQKVSGAVDRQQVAALKKMQQK
jgi:copper homeostasis protein